MSEKSAIFLYTDFSTHLKNLNFTRLNIEKVFSQNKISKRDAEQVYKGLFLDAVSSFEMFLENIFLGLLIKRYKINKNKVVPKIQFKKINVARKIVIPGSYFNWLPYGNTSKIAKNFFRKGRPFCLIVDDPRFSSDDFNSKLEKIHATRNAIAHKSKHAQKQFKIKVLDNTISLPPEERKVAAYLRGVYRSSPSHTRYEKFIIDMATIVKVLCENI